MRFWLVVGFFLMLPLSGCVGQQENPPSQESTPGATANPPCPLAYPDGAPIHCEQFEVQSGPLPTTAPTFQQGWVCTAEFHEQNLISRIFVHQDGRVGTYWKWRTFSNAGGILLSHAVIYDPQGNQGVHHSFQSEGWYVFPRPPSQEARSEGGLHVYFHHFLLHVREGEQWVPYEDQAQFHVSQFKNGDGWYAWKVPLTNGTNYLDLNRPRDEPERGSTHRPRSVQWLEEEPAVVATVLSSGLRWSGRPLFVDAAVNTDNCATETLGVPI